METLSRTLTSWGCFPPYAQTAHPCRWQGDLACSMGEMGRAFGEILPFGNGLSYGDSCLATSDHVLLTRPLDRFISADWQRGILVAESGMTLEELLAVAIPKGWFLPVTPGTKYATLGGALANDVHGKNHHVRGTFGCHVGRFGLLRSDRSPMVCSASENSDLFSATIGGLGLTGVITWIELNLIPIRSSQIRATHIRFGSLADFFALSNEFDGAHEYTVSWIDCLAKGSSTGRGVFMVGDHADDGALEVNTQGRVRMPFTLPASVVTPLTLRAFNTAYYRAHKASRHHSIIDYDPFFYPLDRILEWNRIYGPKGFQQYQCVIPDGTSKVAARELLDVIAAAGTGSFLAVMKRCGNVSSPGLLSFPLPGVSLALDFPHDQCLNRDIFPRIDEIVQQAGGRLYPAKDAHMSGEHFRRFYPLWEKVEALRDPVLNSRFWKRVTSS